MNINMDKLKDLIENILYHNNVHQRDLEYEYGIWEDDIKEVYNHIKNETQT